MLAIFHRVRTLPLLATEELKIERYLRRVKKFPIWRRMEGGVFFNFAVDTHLSLSVRSTINQIARKHSVGF
jgi:hypothetical protein